MKWSHFQVPMLAVILLFSASLVGGAKPVKDKEAAPPNYFPLQIGNEWHFQVSAGGNTGEVISRIAKIENIDGTKLARLEFEVKGDVVTTEHLSQTEKGLFRHRFNGAEVDPPLCLLQYPVKTGAKWGGQIKTGKDKSEYSCETKEEDVEIGTEKFKTIRVDLRAGIMGQVVKTSYWFVRDVGFVKQTAEIGNVMLLLELQKFKPKK